MGRLGRNVALAARAGIGLYKGGRMILSGARMMQALKVAGAGRAMAGVANVANLGGLLGSVAADYALDDGDPTANRVASVAPSLRAALGSRRRERSLFARSPEMLRLS